MLKTFRSSLILFSLVFVFTILVFAKPSLASVTVNSTTVTLGGTSCSTGAGATCGAELTNKTQVGQAASGNPFTQITSSEGISNWQPSGTIQSKPVTLGSTAIDGVIHNIPGGYTSGVVAAYACSVGGVLQNEITAPVQSDGTWSVNLPDTASCSLEVRSPDSAPSGNTPTACNGTAGNPCYAAVCQSGACNMVSTHADGSQVQPGEPGACVVNSDCFTDLTVSISPDPNTITAGNTATYAVTFAYNPSKKYRYLNVFASAGGLNNSNFAWSGSGYDNPGTNPSLGRLDMQSGGSIASSKTLQLNVSGAAAGSYTVHILAQTGDVNGVNSDYTYVFANCNGNCIPSKNATLTVQAAPPAPCDSLITSSPTFPSPSSLACTNVTSNSYTLNWNLAGGTYSAQYVRIASTTSSVIDGTCHNSDPANCPNSSNTTMTSYGATNLAPGVTYSNRVAAVCTNNDGSIGYKDTGVISCSTTSSSACLSNPTASTINSSPAGQNIYLPGSTGSLTFVWNAVSGVSSYTISLYDWNNYALPVFIGSQTVSGTTATFNSITPGASGTRYGYTIVSNSAQACSPTGVMAPVNVFPPASSCPSGTSNPITLTADKTVLNSGETTTVRVPASYTCTSFSSNSPSVSVSLVDSKTASVTNNNSSAAAINATISASGCVYQGGPSCSVGATNISANAPSTPAPSYDFILSPNSFSFSGFVGNVSSIACKDMNTQAAAGNTANIQVAPVYYMESNNYPQISYDQKVAGTGQGYTVSPGNWYFANGNICLQDSPLLSKPGSYTETIAYAGYTDSSTQSSHTKLTGDQYITVSVTLANPQYSYTVSPSTLTFTAQQGASLPGTQSIAVHNTGNIALTVNVSEGLSWLDIDRNTLTLQPDETKNVIASINTTNPSGAPSSYNGNITFTETNAGNKQVGVTYNVTAPGVGGPSSATASARTCAAGGGISVSFSGVSGGTGTYSYNIYRSTTASPVPSTPLITGLTASPYIDTSVTGNTTYYYWVQAESGTTGSQVSAGSATANDCNPPLPPGGGSGGGGASCGQISLTWTSASGVDGYYIYRNTINSTSSGTSMVKDINSGSTTSYSDSPGAGGTYWYWITSYKNPGPVQSAYLAFSGNPLGSSSCDASLGSNKDILKINGNTPSGYTTNPDSSNETPANITYNKNDLVTFAINITSSATAGLNDAKNILVTDRLINLKKPDAASGWALTIGGVNGSENVAASCASTAAALASLTNNQYVVCGTEPNQYLYIKVPNISAGSAAVVIQITGKLTTASGYTQNSSRFQNSAVIGYTKNNSGGSGQTTASTPLLLFSTSDVPTKTEIAP